MSYLSRLIPCFLIISGCTNGSPPRGHSTVSASDDLRNSTYSESSGPSIEIDPTVNQADISKILDLVAQSKECLKNVCGMGFKFSPVEDANLLSELVRFNEPYAISTEVVQGERGIAVFFSAGERIAVLRMSRKSGGYRVHDIALMMP